MCWVEKSALETGQVGVGVGGLEVAVLAACTPMATAPPHAPLDYRKRCWVGYPGKMPGSLTDGVTGETRLLGRKHPISA